MDSYSMRSFSKFANWPFGCATVKRQNGPSGAVDQVEHVVAQDFPAVASPSAPFDAEFPWPFPV